MAKQHLIHLSEEERFKRVNSFFNTNKTYGSHGDDSSEEKGEVEVEERQVEKKDAAGKGAGGEERENASQKKNPAIYGNALLLLITIARNPSFTLMRLYSAMNLSGSEGRSARLTLRKYGFVKEHDKIKKPGRGGHPKILEPLPKAISFLKENFGIEMYKPIKGGQFGRGSFLHNVYVYEVGEWFRSMGCKEILYDINMKTPDGENEKDVDVHGIHVDGGIWIAEICFTGSPSHNADDLVRAGSLDVSEVFAVFTDKKLLESVKKNVDERDLLEIKPIRFLHVSEILYKE